MARKTYEQLNVLLKKYNTSRLWSFSRLNCYVNCKFSYFLKYIKKEKEKTNNIYSVLGGQFHDILEKFYQKKITYEQMIEEADSAILGVSILEMKFVKNDGEKNEGIETKYFECMRHFFQNHIPVKEKVLCEQFIITKIGNHYFQGYIDAVHKEENVYIITDYKSSTIYSGQKIHKEGRQLMLYALSLHQSGIPIERIKIRWNFLKYVSLTFTQKNDKVKTMNAERWAWAGKLKSQLRMNLKDMKEYTDDEIEGLLDQCMELNSISILPEKIQDKYTFSDCYVDIPIDSEILVNLEQEFGDIIKEIYTKEAEYDKLQDDGIFHKEVDAGCSYFCSNICGYDFSQCKHYRKFIQNGDMFKTEENKVIKTNQKDNKVEQNDEDDLWLKELGLL